MKVSSPQLNKVILIGGNNHSGLGVARSFGVNGIRPYGVIIDKERDKGCFVSKSKYWEKVWIVENEESAIELICSIFYEEEYKAVIIPWSDNAAACIDNNYNLLKDRFILPSIDGKQGKIVKYMDKYFQVDFANKYDISMAKTWIVDLKEDLSLDNIVFPCIVKPVVSYEGNKLDICKSSDLDLLIKQVNELKVKGYNRILIQEYVEFEYEYVLSGCCGKHPAYYACKNIRSWPKVGGTGSFAQCTNEKAIHDFAIKILDALREINYSGLFDIEVFADGSKIYLNEINWRIGGKDYFSLSTGVHYAVIWYYSVINRNVSNISNKCHKEELFCMDEATDLRHAFFGNLSFSKWLSDCKKTSSYALWYKGDLKPAFTRYFGLLKEIIKRGKKG